MLWAQMASWAWETFRKIAGVRALSPALPRGPRIPTSIMNVPSSGCMVVGESLTQQVQNPVALFSTDNNGVIIELPSVSAPEASLSGSLVFGIGTQSNNGLNGATVYPVDDDGNFITTFNSAKYDESFIDSGSNGFFFPLVDTALF